MINLDNAPFLHHQPQSDGRMVLLLHGLGGGVYELQPLAEALAATNLSTCAILYPGHDHPAKTMPTSTWQQWYERVLTTYQELRDRYPSISVVGFSTGCLLALKLALEQSVTELTLLSPYLRVRPRWYYLLPPEAYLFSLGYLIRDVPRLSLPIRDRTMRAAAEAAAYFQTFNLAAVRSAIELIDQLKPQLPNLQTPTLIVQSRQDSVVDPKGAQFLYDQLGSPQKSLVWLETSDHIIPLDEERQQIFDRTLEFLRRATP
jgi:carboxylesterase